MFLDQGLAAALIQKNDLKQEHLDAVFWMDLALSFFLFLASVVFSGWWARLNHAPDAAPIIAVISVSIIIEALSVVQKSLLRRQMDFKSLAMRTNISVLVSGVVGIGMAFGGFRVWALVGQQIARDFVALVLLWTLSPWRPRLKFSWGPLRDLMGFSVPNFAAQLANFAEGQAGPVVIGLLFGPLALGLFRLASRFVNCVVVVASSSIQAVSLPEFSRLQDHPAELRTSALSCVRLSSTVALPALAGLAAVSDPLMSVLGPEWAPASNVLKVLSVAGMFIIFAYFTGPLLQALARTHQLAILEWARTVVGILLLTVAGFVVRGGSVNAQIMAISLASLATSAIIVAPVYLYILMRLANLSLRDLTASVLPSVAAAATVASSAILFQSFRASVGLRPTAQLAAEAIVGFLAGGAALLTFDSHLRAVATRSFAKTFWERQVATSQD